MKNTDSKFRESDVERCPHCNSDHIGGLIEAFWIPLNISHSRKTRWEEESEIGPSRHCYDCEQTWMNGYEPTHDYKRELSWMDRGTVARLARLDRGETLAVVAARLGRTVVDVSRAERGEIDPSFLEQVPA
jgi:hypothetical protein